MRGKDKTTLRTGFTTGACATAAATAACRALLTGKPPEQVTILLPNGRTPVFELQYVKVRERECEAAVRKDAGDDPDVTHGALIVAGVKPAPVGSGIAFKAGIGVGMVTRPGLPVEVGEPAINPVPRRMIRAALAREAEIHGGAADFEVMLSVPGGTELARNTWNPRLGIVGGISILGTTGIVRPYSCSAWIASIHRGVDVARAGGADHVVGSTGAQSEIAAQQFYGLPDWRMLDMGDFVGGLLKYLRRHPIPLVTIAGGFAKITKLAQGAVDLHSSRSQVRFDALARLAAETGTPDGIAADIAAANTAMQALEMAGHGLAHAIAVQATARTAAFLEGVPIETEIMIIDRSGKMVARNSSVPFPQGRART
ncbi:MAG: cobalt-precorrin-5B (C(1))-methyltransferase [Rhodobacteraceae bacterium]|nr:cobalt-precorrin-5B (C(1))-methyltransferase [Paracoccaceae bacterium]